MTTTILPTNAVKAWLFSQNSDGTLSPATIGGGSGTVTAVTGAAPIISSGGTAPQISCPTCTTNAAALTNGNLVQGNGGQATSDSGIATANVVSAASNITTNVLAKGNGTKGLSASTITDAGAGVTIGTPTGGAQGVATLNATGLFVAGGAVQVQTNVGPGCMSGCTYGVGNGDGYPLYGSTTTTMANSGSINQPQVVRFYNQSLRKLGNALIRVALAGAAGHASVGVYSITGTLLWTTGSQSTATLNTTIAVTPTPVNLLANTSYYLAWCADTTTATLLGPTNSGTANGFPSLTGSPANTWGVNATDVCTAGVLPGTMTPANIANNSNASVPALLAVN